MTTLPNIPDAAVEAAALAALERDSGFENWLLVTAEVRTNYLDEARTILEAAAPHLMAEAWEEGHSAGRRDEYCLDPNPYRAAGAGE